MLKKLILTISVLLFALVICSSVSAVNGMTEQVNLNTDGGQPNGDSLNPTINQDGNYIAYSSDASNLVVNDTNGKSDIFVFNNYTNQTYRVSVNSINGQSNGNSYNPSISSNGRYIAFDSVADNLVPLDTNRCSDIFIHDMFIGDTSRIGLNSTVLQLNGNSYNPSISGDGNYIVFEHYDTTISGSYGTSTIYLYNKTSRNCTVIDKGINPVINANGTCVVYQTSQRVLVGPGLPSGIGTGYLPGIGTVSGDSKIQLYYLNGTTITVSVDPYGNEANGPSYNPSINSDGTIIAFQSNANNLCPGDTAGNTDIFVHNTKTGMTSRVSVSSSNQQANGASTNPSISGDGRYIIFCSFANNLVNGDTNWVSDIFRRDRLTGLTTRISLDSMGNQLNIGSYMPAISSDGNYAVFLLKSSIDSGYRKVLVHDCMWIVNHGFTINQIKAAATTVRNSIETNHKLPDKVTIGGTDITISQFLELLTRATIQINQEGNNDIIPLFSFSEPTTPKDNIQSGNIFKSEYLKIAYDIKYYMDSNGKAPDFAYQTSLGTYLGFENLVYMYSMILDYYNTSGNVAAYAAMKPWSIVTGLTFSIDQIKAAASTVRSDIENGYKLPDKVTIAGTDVTMPQFLELLTSALLQINSRTNNTMPLLSFNAPTSPIENIHAGNIFKTEYLKIANDVKNYMDSSGKTPDFAYRTSLGTYLRFENLVYMYSMILDYHHTSGKMADFAMMKPWSVVTSPVLATFSVNQIKAAASNVRLYVETYHQLPITVNIAGIDVNMSQFLELTATATIQINSGSTSLISLKNYIAPTSPIENIHAGNIFKTEYLKIANDVKNYMDSSGKTPDFAYRTSLGTYLRFENLVYMYSMILDYYNTSGNVAAYAAMKPWAMI